MEHRVRAPCNVRRVLGPGTRTWAGIAAVLVLSIASWIALGGLALNYDAQWAVDWGQALARGETPDYETTGAPTAHPFVTVAASLATLLFGDGAPAAIHALAHISHAVLIVVCVLIAAHLFGRVAAVMTAVGLIACAPLSENVALGFQDVTAAALIMAALLAEFRRPDRPALPFVLLAIGGTLRPEVWLLTGAYWLYRAWRASWANRVKYALLAALGPFLWMLSDLVITGDPFVSFTRTRDGAEAAERTTGLAEGPAQLVDNLRSGLGTVWLVGAFAGAAVVIVAARRRDERLARRGQLELVALAGLLTGAFLMLAVAELSLLERYLIALMSVVVVLFAFAIGGWERLPSSPLRWAWIGVAVVLALRAVIAMPDQLDRADAVVDYGRDEADALDRLDDLMKTDAVGVALDRCDVAATSSYRITPYAAFALERPPKDLPAIETAAELPPRSVWVAPRSALGAAFTTLGRPSSPPPAPVGARTVSTNSDWVVFAVGC